MAQEHETGAYVDENAMKAAVVRELWLAGVDAETALEAHAEPAKQKDPRARPRIISDNRPQFIAKDFRNSFGSRA